MNKTTTKVEEAQTGSRVVPLGEKPKPKPKPKKPVKQAAKRPMPAAQGQKLAARIERSKPLTPGKDGSRGWGPGTKQFKFKPVSLRGECDVLGCKAKARTPTSYRCAKHKKEIRKVQLRENNQTWFKRIEKGTAKHHVVYTSPVTNKQELTEWALANPDKALAQVKKGISIVEPDEFKKLLAASKAAKAAGKKGAKGRSKA